VNPDRVAGPLGGGALEVRAEHGRPSMRAGLAV
jgi:hypothetical protein